MWGAPGTMLAAAVMLDRTGDERFAEAWADSAERLWGQWGEDGFWVQDLYGKHARYIGPAHGMAGNVRVLARGGGFDEAIRVRVATALEATAVRTRKFANWPPLAGGRWSRRARRSARSGATARRASSRRCGTSRPRS